MNSSLCCEFKEEEVLSAMKQMAPLKAPGPDGMPSLFYQHFWSTVDKDVITLVLSRLNSGTLPHPLNHTFVTLIPKTKNPEYVHQFRPISLCNVLYKILSKLLANCLKTLLPMIITEHQSAFTKDRLISDNIMIAFETLHNLHRYNSKKGGFIALKLDMSKAYGRVEWSFLEELIRKMRFNEKWINLIMLCVKMVTYSILIDGEPKGLIHQTRGIRYGDPLSPFLFLLCMEGLNGLIKHAKRNGDIHRFSLCRRGPKLTHLLFVDDSLLFCRSTEEECDKMLKILETYERALGQKVNKDKTSLFFSRCTPPNTKTNIKRALGV